MKNIFNWYEFKPDSKILEVNEGDNIEANEQWDYVILIGITNLESALEKAAKVLNYDGRILIATNNKFGIKCWAKAFDNCSQTDMSKSRIEKLIDKVGFKYYKFYYPLPDYNMANVIFTDEYLPNEENILRNLEYADENEFKVFRELEALKQIVKEAPEYFKIFANSFFIEISNEHIKSDVKFVSFNNMRKLKYRLMTTIKEKEVIKTYTNELAKEHINKIGENIKILEKQNFLLLDRLSNDENSIISKVCPEENMLIKQLKNKYISDDIINLMIKLKDYIYEKSDKYIGGQTVFEKYNITMDEQLNKELHYIKHGMLDLTIFNCFYIDNNYYFFDQEWYEENVPVEYIIYRNICYINNITRLKDVKDIYEKLQITPYLNYFDCLEEVIQKNITDENMLEFYNSNGYQLSELIKKHSELIQELNVKDNRIIELEKTNSSIVNSKGWKMLEKIRRIYKRG